MLEDINKEEPIKQQQETTLIEDYNNVRIKIDEVIKKEVRIPKETFDKLEAELYQKEQNFVIRNNELMSRYMDNKITLIEMGRELESTKIDLNLLKILVNVLEQNMELIV